MKNTYKYNNVEICQYKSVELIKNKSPISLHYSILYIMCTYYLL